MGVYGANCRSFVSSSGELAACQASSQVFSSANLSSLLYPAAKRIMDVFSAFILLALTFPLMLIIALAIRLTSRGPAIYCQRRLTERGRVFIMYKFRTMVENAEQGRGAVMAEDGDARVTAIGLFLRKTRLDELPQLMNVFFGDMSLVGPRPERPEIAIALSKDFPHFWRRLETKAGLTGLAQVKAGYAADSESYQQKLAWDLKYLEQQSLLLDLKIAFQTISVVLTGRGAR